MTYGVTGNGWDNIQSFKLACSNLEAAPAFSFTLTLAVQLAITLPAFLTLAQVVLGLDLVLAAYLLLLLRGAGV